MTASRARKTIRPRVLTFPRLVTSGRPLDHVEDLTLEARQTPSLRVSTDASRIVGIGVEALDRLPKRASARIAEELAGLAGHDGLERAAVGEGQDRPPA